ncbi:MAG TPA: tetratricopeptide repeat protein [Candidatus Lumbricidophila sp.]|nr:tetratricopeptide repeat protein [Candidatus Lumbricidophila sp.]
MTPSDSLAPAALRGAVDLSALSQRPPTPADAAPAAASPVRFDTDDASVEIRMTQSMRVPIVLIAWTQRSAPSLELVNTMVRLAEARNGKIGIAPLEVERAPQLIAALQLQSVPTVIALVAGQPVPLFEGVQPEPVINDLFDRLLELAAQHGVTGELNIASDASPAEPEPTPLPPLHQEAEAALERRDFAAAVQAYKTAIAQDPRDSAAVAGMARAALLGRLNGRGMADIRNAAAAAPTDLEAQLAVADLDVSGGHVDDAFDRVLTLFPTLDADGKAIARQRLLELFEVVGTDDARVAAARRRLTNLLY